MKNEPVDFMPLSNLPPPESAFDEDDEELTLRDRFAMAALPGLLPLVNDRQSWRNVPGEAAYLAYELADEMMKARK